MIRSFASVFLLLAPSLAAQVTHIVDAAGGPGVFSDIQAAVDVAAPGDILRVRPGSYSGWRMQKPLTILADPGAEVNRGTLQSMVAYPLPAGSTTLIRGLRFDASTNSQLISIGREATLILDSVEMAGACDLCDFTSLENLVIDRCKLQGMVMLQGTTTALITDSEIRGVTVPVAAGRSQRPAIRAAGRDQTLWISGTTVLGADAYSPQDRPGLALESWSMNVVIRGDAQTRFVAGGGAQIQSALESELAAASLVYDPTVTFTANGSAPAVRWAGSVTTRRGTVLTSTPAVLGSTLTLNLEAPSGHSHILLAGLPRVPVELGSLGALALAAPIPIAVGGPGTVQHKFLVPNDPVYRGALVGWQTVGSAPGGAVGFGNLTVSIVR